MTKGMMMNEQEAEDRLALSMSIKQLGKHKRRLAELQALRDAEHRQVDEWFDDSSHGEVLEIARLENVIQQWAKAHRTGIDKSWVTPWGSVTTRATKGAVVIDDEAAFNEWCADHGFLAPPKPQKPDVTAVRRAYGDLADVPGAHVEFGDGFNVAISTDKTIDDTEDSNGE